MRILVIEDSTRLGRSLRAGLERWGHEVEVEIDGLEGFRRASRREHDLVVLDLLLPGMHGFEILERLRAAANEIPVIVLSACDTTEDRVRGLRCGADDYLVKPFALEELVARIEGLQRRSARSSGGSGPNDLVFGAQLEGQLLDGRYLLETEIGRGGFATVYRARHLGLSRRVAVKVLSRRGRFEGDDSDVHRFLREGISACRANHPNAVSVFDSGTTEDGVPYLVMELLEGRTLGRELDHHGRLTPERTAQILQPLCDVLSTAHRAGVIHRDIKPDNIFLHTQGSGETVKVLDFGLAKWLWPTADAELTMLHTGAQLLGTLPFLAPERVRGDACDGRSDVYSLSVVLFMMLAGRPPYPLTTSPYRLLSAICFDDPPSLRWIDPSIRPELDAVVLRGLAKDPAHRPGASQLWEEFDDAVAA